jgi:hypothetical protein
VRAGRSYAHAQDLTSPGFRPTPIVVCPWISNGAYPYCGGPSGGWGPGLASSKRPTSSVTDDEAAAVDYVLQHARAGDVDDVLATIDKFA